MIFIIETGLSQVFFPDRKVYATAGKEMKNQNPLALFWQNNKIIFTLGEPFCSVPVSLIQSRWYNSGFIQPDGITPIAPGTSAIISVTDPFVIAPNPVNDFALIKAPSEWEGNVIIQLIDNSGKLIKTYLMESKTLSIDFQEGIIPGMYYLNLYNLEGTILQQNKIIKVN